MQEREDRLKVVRGGRRSREDEFSRLYREAYPIVFNYVSFRMGGSSEAEDVTAEAFMKAARAFSRFDPTRSKFSTWVITIARNSMFDSWSRKRPQAALDDVPEGVFSVEDDYDGLDSKEEEAKHLLAGLEERDRELVYLKYYQGMRNKEIAHELGLNESTVASRLQRALLKMRAVAQAEGIEP